MAIGDFELAKQNLQEKIDKAEQEGEISMDFSEFESLKQQMAELEAKKDTYGTVVENAELNETSAQKGQIENLGGDPAVLEERLQATNEEIHAVEKVLKQKTEGGPDGDIDHKVNEELEPGSHVEEEIQSPNLEDQDAKKFEEFKNKVNQQMGAAIEEFKTTGNMYLFNKFQKSLESYLHSNLDTPQGRFLKEFESQAEAAKNELLKNVVETRKAEYESLANDAKLKWEQYVNSGDLENSTEYRNAVTAIAISQGLNSDDAPQKMQSFRNLIQNKSWEISKPIEDLRLKVVLELALFDKESEIGKEAAELYQQIENFKLEQYVPAMKELTKKQEERIAQRKGSK